MKLKKQTNIPVVRDEMSFFSNDALENLRNTYATTLQSRIQLIERYALYAFQIPRAKEYATHGFARRLATLGQCLDRVFELLPPDREDLPTAIELKDAAINIQAFVFNVFGSVDNLAWIWISEKEITQDNGEKLPRSWIGLRPGNNFVRDSLSAEFQGYLNTLNDWFIDVEDFRHSLAHRIPLYIPPYGVPECNLAEYQDFECRMNEAMQAQNFELFDRLNRDQEGLVQFRPVMRHSFEEAQGAVVFHPQMLVDYNTVVELGRRMLEELAR